MVSLTTKPLVTQTGVIDDHQAALLIHSRNNEASALQASSEALPAAARGGLARQLTRSTVLSAQISMWDTSADLPSAYFPRRSR